LRHSIKSQTTGCKEPHSTERRHI